MCGLGDDRLWIFSAYKCSLSTVRRRGVTPEQLLSGARHRAERLGSRPPNPRDQARWRERRESAASALAEAADWDAVLLSRAVLLGEEADDPVKELLIEARDYCPRRSHGPRA